MECIEARALKSSFLSEIAMKKSNQQVSFDDFWCVNGINGVPADDFSVDVFLDFSDKDFNEEEEEEDKDSLSSTSAAVAVADDDNCNSVAEKSESVNAGELGVPVDELKDLEWLSNFVDDSVSEFSLQFPAGTGKVPPATKTKPPCFPSPVPAKARTKRSRSRPVGRTWSLSSPSLSSSSSSSISSCISSSTPCLIFTNRIEVFQSLSETPTPAKKKPKRKPTGTGDVAGGCLQRRCTHCHVQKTPQWRAGPLGPKTLCNACGVRFKSGRLFPEYRPACSPTFSGEVHSNSHRKVLEMRRKKETVETESGSVPGPVHGPVSVRVF